MLTSELIKALNDCLKQYGDLPVSLQLQIPVDPGIITTDSKEILHFRKEEYEDREPELAVSDFPY